MTLLIGVRGLDFAVIGADRRGTVERSEGERRVAFSVDHPKVAARGDFAYGSSGLGLLGSQTTLDVVTDGLKDAETSGEVGPTRAGAILGGRLGFLVTQERNSWPADMQSGSAKVTVLLAGMAEDGVHLMVITADAPALPEVPLGEIQRYFATCPDSVRPFVVPLLSSKFEQASDIESGVSIAEQLRDLILEAIEQERQIRGENHEIGGGVDVAIVDREGVRFLDPGTA